MNPQTPPPSSSVLTEQKPPSVPALTLRLRVVFDPSEVETLAKNILEKLVSDSSSPDPSEEEFEKILASWNQESLEKYATSTLQLRNTRGATFMNNLFTYIKKRAKTGRADFGKLDMEHFRTFLCYADWLKANTASTLINNGLWVEGFPGKEPHFRLRLAFPGVFGLRLTGRAVHPPETEASICEFYKIAQVLPHLYAGVRYKTLSLDSSSTTLCFVTIGTILIQKDRGGQMEWKDTGYVFAVPIHPHDIKSYHRNSIFYLIFNSTDEDATYPGLLQKSANNAQGTIMKLDSDPRDLLELPNDPKRPGTTPIAKSYKKPEFAELGMKGSFATGNQPIPLFPISDCQI